MRDVEAAHSPLPSQAEEARASVYEAVRSEAEQFVSAIRASKVRGSLQHIKRALAQRPKMETTQPLRRSRLLSCFHIFLLFAHLTFAHSPTVELTSNNRGYFSHLHAPGRTPSGEQVDPPMTPTSGRRYYGGGGGATRDRGRREGGYSYGGEGARGYGGGRGYSRRGAGDGRELLASFERLSSEERRTDSCQH